MQLRRPYVVIALPLVAIGLMGAGPCDQQPTDPGAQNDPNPHQPKPPAPPRVTHSNPSGLCDFQFSVNWNRIHGGGVVWEWGIYIASTPGSSQENSGGQIFNLRRQSCTAHVISAVHPVKRGVFDDPKGIQGSTSCAVTNLTTGETREDAWHDELDGSKCELG